MGAPARLIVDISDLIPAPTPTASIHEIESPNSLRPFSMARKQPNQHSRTPVRSLRSAAAAATPSSSQELAILDDADTDAPLTELDSADVPVPTQYQQTNKDSVEVLSDGQPVFQVPFNYTWLRWSDPALDGCR
ncbi:hypothetical protein BDV95DRAFT_588551, partial [Massariosphaeria phaeospora]